MFQDAALFPWLTARGGNIELALQLADKSSTKASRRARATELLELVHLGGAGGDKRPPRAVRWHEAARCVGPFLGSRPAVAADG